MRLPSHTSPFVAAGLLVVLAGTALWAGAPIITNQPASQIIFVGCNATFAVGASGTAPLFFQWRRNGETISGGTNSSYTQAAVSSADHNSAFSVIVSNSLGTAMSAPALLRVDSGTVTNQSVRLLTISNFWRWNGSNVNLGTNWITPACADAGWPQGRGTFDGKKPARATLPNGEPVRTQLALTNAAGTNLTTFYFRTHFTNNITNAFSVTLEPTLLADDGVALYLNGAELYRLGLATNAAFFDFATRTVNDANFEGPFTITNVALAAGDNVLAAEIHQTDGTSSDATFGLILDAHYTFRAEDTNPPVIVGLLPAAGAVVPVLEVVDVAFSEPVEGVDASDLRVNGVPATGLIGFTPQQYRWSFPVVTNGAVNFTWAANHGIYDITARSNQFAGTSWSVTVNPAAAPPNLRVVISEFMAANKSTLRDEDGDYSDWIELYNDEAVAVDLGGWSLTDTPNNLAKWKFPSAILPAKGCLLVFASGKNRTNSTGQLHANFSLAKDGEFLGLSNPSGTLVSAFAPVYPPQEDDVSFGRDRLDPNLTGYYATPTPGANNAVAGPGFGPEVVFSRAGGTFTTSFPLTLSTPGDNSAVIHYLIVTNAQTTAITNVPTTSSPLYTGPITVDRTMFVRARAFVTNAAYLPGPPRSEGFLQLGANMTTFDSDLPVVVLHTLGSTATISSGDPNPDQVVLFGLFEPRFGVTSLLNPPAIFQRAAIHLRGATTGGFSKASYSVELQDEFGDDDAREVLGMPGESDWVLYAPNVFDLSLLANPLVYRLGRDLGAYAPRTRFVELLLNQSGAALGMPSYFSSTDYRGVYVLVERIKRDPNRVDIDALQPEPTNAPAITGGYLCKLDRIDPGERRFSFAGLPPNWNSWSHQDFIYQDPPGLEMVTPQRASQAAYLTNYLGAFTAALTAPDWTNRVTGYAPYVNWSSAIDYHLLNTVTFNCDALRLSSYFYKPRNGPLAFGPLWDFDRSLGTCYAVGTNWEVRPFNPFRFISWEADSGGNGGTDMFNGDFKYTNIWWGRMFLDIDFFQAWIDRYQEMRETALATNALFGLIDQFANEVRRAKTREEQRWNSGDSDTRPRSGTVAATDYSYFHTFPGTYQGEVDFLKEWLTDRFRFMDTNFLAKPALDLPGGWITNGFQLTLTDRSGKPGTTLYYTLDGTDPRAPFGGIAAGAIACSGPVTLASNALVTVRARNPGHANLTGLPGKMPLNSIWSGPAKACFYTATPPLRITEIMYHPAAPPAGNTNEADNFEYLEFKNISAAPLRLQGFRLTNGIDFTFANLTLAAGATCVAVADAAAFQSRYGSGPLVAGQYTNRLDNAGERLVLEGPLGEPVLDFEYDDEWYPATDGGGFSLVIVDPAASNSTWGLKSSWRPGGALNGSPGTNEFSAPGIAPILIAEALTHTDLPQVDGLELYNPTATNVDLGGWFLSDAFGTPKKYRIPAGTIIGPGARLVFYEDTTFGTGPNSFLLSALGDDIWLFSGDANTNLTGYAHGFSFDAQENGATFGRYVNSISREHFVTEKANSLGSANLGPLIGPIVISEFAYHPPDIAFGFQLFDNVRDEFVQLSNLSGQPVPLFDPLAPTNTWQLDGGVSFSFPTNITLAAGKNLIIVGFNPATEPAALAAFRTNYPASTNATLLGPWNGKLNNDEDTIRLERPDPPNLDGFVPYLLVEKVHYHDSSPWTPNADGTTLTMHRTPPNSFADDPASWTAGAPTAGLPVTNVNTAPIAFSQSVTNAEDTAFAITLTGSDTDGPVMNFVVVTNPAHGTLSGPAPNLTYTPASNYFGADSFTFHVNDGSLTSALATVSITLTSVNDAPVASTDALVRSMSQGVSAPVGLLLTNDSDIEGNPLSLLSVASAAPGGASLHLNSNLVTYWPPFGNTNAGSFTYIISDGNGAFATGLVNVAVLPDPAGFDVLSLTAQPGAMVVVKLAGIPGFAYTVQFTGNLTPPNWQSLLVSTADESGRIYVSDTFSSSSTNRFYRTVRGIMP